MPQSPLRGTLAALAVLVALAVSPVAARADEGTTFDDDVAFLRQRLEVVVLGEGTGARVAIVPAWQGRVDDLDRRRSRRPSYGWLNRELAIVGKARMPHINAFGGEDRFWLGPEGGQYAIFFATGRPVRPRALADARAHRLGSLGGRRSIASEVRFRAGDRARQLRGNEALTRSDPPARFEWWNLPPRESKLVGFESENTITNTGGNAWTREHGAPLRSGFSACSTHRPRPPSSSPSPPVPRKSSGRS